MGDDNGVMPSVAMKMNRHFIHLTGSTPDNINSWEETAKCRLIAVMEGRDSGDVEKDDPFPSEYNVGSVNIDVLTVSRKEMRIDRSTGAISFTETIGEDINDFYSGLVGAYRRNNSSSDYYGLNGKHVIVFDSEEFLDTGMLSYLAAENKEEKITIVAERIELAPNVPLPKNVSVLHAPFNLIWR